MALQIEKPCQQNFEGMAPTENGRFCNQCQSTVIDFTNYSDAELLNFFDSQNSRSVCGRLTTEQLNRPIETENDRDIFRMARISLLGASLMASPLFAQKTTSPIAETPIPSMEEDEETQAATARATNPGDGVLRITGTVYSKTDMESIAYVNIEAIVENKVIRVVTETDGSFELIIPSFDKINPVTLSLRHIGFATQEIVISEGYKHRMKIYMSSAEYAVRAAKPVLYPAAWMGAIQYVTAEPKSPTRRIRSFFKRLLKKD